MASFYNESGLRTVAPETETWSKSLSPIGNRTGTPQSIEFVETRISMFIWTYLTPIVVVIGTIGNVLSFAVLLRSRMRSTSVYFYLIILACADTTILYISAFKTWIRVVTGFELLQASNIWCKSTFFFTLVSFHLAAWIIVLITLDRFVVVWFPLKVATMCIVSRARLATLVLVVVIVVYNLHVFWTFELQQSKSGEWRCLPGDDYSWFMRLPFNILRLITYSLLPFFTILVLNVAIIVRLLRAPLNLHSQGVQYPLNHHSSHYHTQHDVVPAGAVQLDGSSRSRSFSAAPRPHMRLIYMLMSVSIAWLILTAPWTAQALVSQIPSTDRQVKAREELAKTVCFMLYYINHSINFFLYCITGNRFRRELVDLFVQTARRVRRPWPVNSPSVKTTRSNCVEMDAAPGGGGGSAPSKISKSDSKI